MARRPFSGTPPPAAAHLWFRETHRRIHRHDNILEPARQFLQSRDVGIAYMFLMRNPVRDYGPWLWHRDCGSVPYRLYELPTDFDVDTFVASWS